MIVALSAMIPSLHLELALHAQLTPSCSERSVLIEMSLLGRRTSYGVRSALLQMRGQALTERLIYWLIA